MDSVSAEPGQAPGYTRESTDSAHESSVTGAAFPTTSDRAEETRQNRPIFWIHAVSPTSALSINATPGSSAKAILSEIKVCAERLLAFGESSSIDLRFLKSMPEERATLASLLGFGEVSAVVNSIGRSEIQETVIPCVWWVRHLNSEDEMVGELIEITDIPELLVGDRASIALALEALRTRIQAGVN